MQMIISLQYRDMPKEMVVSDITSFLHTHRRLKTFFSLGYFSSCNEIKLHFGLDVNISHNYYLFYKNFS